MQLTCSVVKVQIHTTACSYLHLSVLHELERDADLEVTETTVYRHPPTWVAESREITHTVIVPGVIDLEIQSESEDRKYKQTLREPLSRLDKVSNNLVNE